MGRYSQRKHEEENDAVINAINSDSKFDSYVNNGTYVGVAGYVKSGESGEEAALREVNEELGLSVLSVTPVKTYPYVKKDMLMLGYLVRVEHGEFNISGEVDKADWFAHSDAVNAVREGSIIQKLLLDVKNSL